MARSNCMVRTVGTMVAAALVALAGMTGPALGTPVDETFTFQGELKNGSSPATGSWDFRCRLYDAAVGGALIAGPTVVTATLSSDGRFAAQVLFPGVFSGQNRYLDIEASPAGLGTWQLLTPRQLLSASPNAAWSIASGTAANSTNLGGQPAAFYTNAANLSSGTLPSARLTGSYTAALNFSNAANVFAGSGTGLTGLNASNVASGTLADARLSTNVALLNLAQSFTAAKTFSVAPAFTAVGTPFTTSSTTLVTNLNADLLDGQHGAFYQNAGNLTGTIADARLSTNVALLNLAQTFTANKSFTGNNGFGTTTPLYPIHVVDNDGSFPVYIASDTNSTHYGVYADLNGTGTGAGFSFYTQNPSPGGHGFRAFMSGSTGNSIGISVSNSSTAGKGGEFINTATTGTTYGVYCENNSADGYGLFALHDASTGTGPAIFGRTDSTASQAFGVHGLVNTTAAGSSSAGVRGENLSTSALGIGVWGSQAGGGWGVYGSTATGYGVYGQSTGTGIGVRGFSTGSYGGYFDTGVAGGVALYVVGTASVGVLTIRGGADLAENFEVAQQAEEVQPGMLVMIDPEHTGGVTLAHGAYNKLVAGVISGANDLSAGMVLGHFDGQKDAKPVALTGRVWTYVDGTDAAVEPGDLLTSSDTPGYAMKVTDSSKAQGATIGKAMSKLAKGEKGMVLVLVNLQ
jgi:hypothetical protein